MSRIIIYPYHIASASSKHIAEALRQHGKKTIRVYPNRRFRARPSDTIINFGNTQTPTWDSRGVFNKPLAVGLAVNKLETFRTLETAGVRTVPFTTDIYVARAWGTGIVERHLLRAYGGRGIRIPNADTVQRAPLYTQLLHPSEEYRVHVWRGEVIDYAKKVKRNADGTLIMGNDEVIKNRAHGWEFLRDVAPRSGVIRRALDSVAALGLDFGVVDVLRHNNKSYVLEVGTAPGLSPRGISIYVNKIIELHNEKQNNAGLGGPMCWFLTGKLQWTRFIARVCQRLVRMPSRNRPQNAY